MILFLFCFRFVTAFFWCKRRDSCKNISRVLVNMCSDEPIELGKFIAILERTLSKKANLVRQEVDGSQSPFGLDQSWFMSNKQAQNLGYKFSPIEQWLPDLVLKIADTMKS